MLRLHLFSALLLCCGLLPTVQAAVPRTPAAQRAKAKDKAAPQKAEKSQKAEKPAKSPGLKKALAKLKYISPKKVNPKAKFIIYLESGSKCANCNREMPHVVQEYKEMQELGTVDILLICHDDNEADALAFMKRYGAEFPAVLRKNVSPELLPGFVPAHGIPDWRIMPADAAESRRGGGPVLEEWKRKTVEKPAAPRLPQPPAKA